MSPSRPSREVSVLDLSARTYKCPTCVGTGSMESSDSTDESWWDCRRCNGTGKVADRRQPQRGAVDPDAAMDDATQAITDCCADAHIELDPMLVDKIAAAVIAPYTSKGAV